MKPTLGDVGELLILLQREFGLTPTTMVVPAEQWDSMLAHHEEFAPKWECDFHMVNVGSVTCRIYRGRNES